MRSWIVVLAALLATACASVPPPPSATLFDDALFAAPSQPIRVADIFAVSPEMKRYLAHDIAEDVRINGPRQGLFDALYSRNQLQLEYESDFTRNAAQAFAVRAGNCLSLVIMTAAFAKEMGLPVTYQHIYAEETWARSGDLYLSVGHVNLTLGMRYTDTGSHAYPIDQLTIDFLAPPSARGLRSRPIPEKTIVAMYLNNRAVESLAAGRLDDAYWWAREAIVQQPTFTSAYNTLGAIYERHGDLARAETVLRYAIASEPRNTNAMSNLVPVLDALGRTAEAAALRERLAALDPHPAFAYFDRGVAAMRSGDYQLARTMFEQEVDRAPYYHEFHFWLAAAYASLGELDRARDQMKIAIEMSPTRGERELYAAKLARILAHQAN